MIIIQVSCLAIPSKIKSGASQCVWTSEDTSCTIAKPPTDPAFTIISSLLTMILSIPISLIVRKLLNGPCSRYPGLNSFEDDVEGEKAEKERLAKLKKEAKKEAKKGAKYETKNEAKNEAKKEASSDVAEEGKEGKSSGLTPRSGSNSPRRTPPTNTNSNTTSNTHTNSNSRATTAWPTEAQKLRNSTRESAFGEVVKKRIASGSAPESALSPTEEAFMAYSGKLELV